MQAFWQDLHLHHVREICQSVNACCLYVLLFFPGQIMNEHNPPMMLPNGFVYGEGVS